ncbi:DUF6542 domain-containing protein [Saccharopolyspora cebuensis]|uniref:DUF6542 domain-containing protein n=1 Tax=Saccharopolyspora cebuensis TaxID=418759 RepID=A0ABV4CQD5_9PSEU
MPLWGAVLVPVGATALGTLLDVLIWSKPGLLFNTLFVVGSLTAVAMVRRRGVFGPMVQAPLVLVLVMPIVMLLVGSGGSGGLTGMALAVVNPLISSFPIMASTTAIALGIGLVRMFVTERESAREPAEIAESDAETKKRRKPAKRRDDSGEESPRRRDPDARPAKARAERPQRGERSAKGERPAKGERAAKPDRSSRERARPAEAERGRSPQGRSRGESRAAEERPRRAQPGRGQPERGKPERAQPERGRPERPQPERGRPAPGRGAPPRQTPGRPRPPESDPRQPRRPRRDGPQG